MRTYQLGQRVGDALSDEFKTDISGIPRPSGRLVPIFDRLKLAVWAARIPKNAILVVGKSALKCLNQEVVRRLRDKGVVLCFDPVDTDFRLGSDLLPDAYICSSYSQLEKMKAWQSESNMPTVDFHLLLHAYDSSLENMQPAQEDEFQAAYIGLPENTVIPNALMPQIKIERAGGPRDWQTVLESIRRYNLHYCVRPPNPNPYQAKPLTKVATAGAMNAVVLINRDAEDAEEMLGDDYPFFIESHEDVAVVDGFRRAQNAFGSEEWKIAQDKTRRVARRVGPEAQIDAFKQLLLAIGS